MKKTNLGAGIIAILAVVQASSAYCIQITNYYNHNMRVEAEDCSTYESYKVFPSTQSWMSGNIVNKAKYLFTEDLENGFYSIISGPSIPKKLCFNFADRKYNSQKPIMLSISTYDSCKLDINYNEDGSGFMVYPNYDCFAQELK